MTRILNVMRETAEIPRLELMHQVMYRSCQAFGWDMKFLLDTLAFHYLGEEYKLKSDEE